MTILAAAPWLVDLGRSAREAFFMFWETLWALVLGFGLSGIVQSFVSKDELRTRIGARGPAEVARASGYGMVSSSCSYAASAMAKTLFARGADFVAAMVFMIASTNLVVELGIVLLVLIGWQFLVAQYVGGVIMITLFALVGGYFLRGRVVDAARAKLSREADEPTAAPIPHDVDATTEGTPVTDRAPSRLRSLPGWTDASSFAVADATMLRKELFVGYSVAGLLAVTVPDHAWNALFLQGHGVWTTLENALVGPLIAVISWVCSIGNVPLAAALWQGGISFGGVIAFLFADLIAMPLLIIYRKFYGTRLAVRLVAIFYVVMVTAGLITEGLFELFGAVPTERPTVIATDHFEWNYTTYLNILFLLVAAAILFLHSNRDRLGGGGGLAFDPVCGMQVRRANAPASLQTNDGSVQFCSDRCRDRYESDPERYARGGTGALDR